MRSTTYVPVYSHVHLYPHLSPAAWLFRGLKFTVAMATVYISMRSLGSSMGSGGNEITCALHCKLGYTKLISVPPDPGSYTSYEENLSLFVTCYCCRCHFFQTPSYRSYC